MVETTESRDAEVARIAEILHDLDGTQHYTTHEQGYDGDDIEGVTCATGIEGHMEDAADAYHAGLRSTSRDSEVQEAIALLDVIDGIVDDTHPEGDGSPPCPLCTALNDLRAILDRSSEAAPTTSSRWVSTIPPTAATGSATFIPASEAAPTPPEDPRDSLLDLPGARERLPYPDAQPPSWAVRSSEAAPTTCAVHGPDCPLHAFDHMTIHDAVATAIDELDPNDPPVVNLNLLLRDLKVILDATPEVASSGGPAIDASTSS